MLKKNATIGRHYVDVAYKQQDDGWLVMLTGMDRKTKAEGRGSTEQEAFDAAVAAYELEASKSLIKGK